MRLFQGSLCDRISLCAADLACVRFTDGSYNGISGLSGYQLGQFLAGSLSWRQDHLRLPWTLLDFLGHERTHIEDTHWQCQRSSLAGIQNKDAANDPTRCYTYFCERYLCQGRHKKEDIPSILTHMNLIHATDTVTLQITQEMALQLPEMRARPAHQLAEATKTCFHLHHIIFT